MTAGWRVERSARFQERESPPMALALARCERFLIQTLDPSRAANLSLARILAVLVVAGLVQGSVMGSFEIRPERVWQVAYSAIKVPLLLVATFLICLPSFFVLNTLFGVRSDFARAVRLVLSGQATLAVVLVSLSPYTLLWYASFADYNNAVLFNAVLFGLSALAAQVYLRQSYQPLVLRDRRHRGLLACWLVLFAFVGIQMAWILRPFVGDPTLPTRFFREEKLGNAYVVVGRMLWDAVR